MVRRKISVLNNMGRRTRSLVLCLIIATAAALVSKVWWFAKIASSGLLPPPPMGHDLQHFRKERNLKRYMDSIQLLIEPSTTGCVGSEEVPLLVLVSSLPAHVDRREAIRQTWARWLTTYFVLGLHEPNIDDKLVDIYIEAKLYSDIIVFDLREDYQNLTLKTGLMLQWSQRRCPQAEALLKTDDDVLVNPWLMLRVVKEHADHQLIGYKKNQTKVHRDEYSKWYLPRWLYPLDTIPEYLSGTGYIINGNYIDQILKTAYQVPLVNLEDVYFTQIVSQERLSLILTHDRRISPYKPWIGFSCSWWGLALAHSLTPEEILAAWYKILELGRKFEKGEPVCSWLNFLSSDWFLY